MSAMDTDLTNNRQSHWLNRGIRLAVVIFALLVGRTACLADADLLGIASSPQLPRIVPGGVVYVTGFIPNRSLAVTISPFWMRRGMIR